MQNITYKMSTYDDIGEITALLRMCFGDLAINEGALKRIDGEYLVARDSTGHIVAITGIVADENYDLPVITFTCVKPKMQNLHIMDDMFTYLLKEWDKHHGGPIVLTCWNTGDGARLRNIASRHGFVIVSKAFITRRKTITKSCHNCIYSNKTDCSCCDDLYVRF